MLAARPEQPLQDVGANLFKWLTESFIQPEVERRRANGEWPAEELIYRAQVLFHVDGPTVVRLNREVGGVMNARATRAINAGEDISIQDFDKVLGYQLPEEDGDAAHFTVFATARQWSIVFDGRYNRRLGRQHHVAAGEYAAIAEAALREEKLRAFVENAFAAAELLKSLHVAHFCRPSPPFGRGSAVPRRCPKATACVCPAVLAGRRSAKVQGVLPTAEPRRTRSSLDWSGRSIAIRGCRVSSSARREATI